MLLLPGLNLMLILMQLTRFARPTPPLLQNETFIGFIIMLHFEAVNILATF